MHVTKQYNMMVVVEQLHITDNDRTTVTKSVKRAVRYDEESEVVGDRQRHASGKHTSCVTSQKYDIRLV